MRVGGGSVPSELDGGGGDGKEGGGESLHGFVFYVRLRFDTPLIRHSVVKSNDQKFFGYSLFNYRPNSKVRFCRLFN